MESSHSLHIKKGISKNSRSDHTRWDSLNHENWPHPIIYKQLIQSILEYYCEYFVGVIKHCSDTLYIWKDQTPMLSSYLWFKLFWRMSSSIKWKTKVQSSQTFLQNFEHRPRSSWSFPDFSKILQQFRCLTVVRHFKAFIPFCSCLYNGMVWQLLHFIYSLQACSVETVSHERLVS